jgi:hypothetical protein
VWGNSSYDFVEVANLDEIPCRRVKHSEYNGKKYDRKLKRQGLRVKKNEFKFVEFWER